MASLVAETLAFLLLLATACSCPTNRLEVSAQSTDINLSVNTTGSCSAVSVVAATSYSVAGFVATVADLRAPAGGGAQLTLGDSASSVVLTLTVPAASAALVIQRQAILGADGRFDVSLTKWMPSSSWNVSLASARLTVQPIRIGDCPPGWKRSSYKSNSICHGVPAASGNANFADSANLCRLMRANLAIDFTSFATLEPATVRSWPHWVGVMERNEKLYYVSGQPYYLTPSKVPPSPSCSPASGACGCVYYHSGTFYRDSCNSHYAQLCSAPVGGVATDKYYDPSSIAVYISQWAASSDSDSPTAVLLWRSYWPAFAVSAFVLVGMSIGIRMFYRMRAIRAMERRSQMPAGGVAVAAMQPPPPGSYPTQAATDLAVWQQPQTMDHQPPPPYSSYYNTGFQADQAAFAGATAPAAPPNETKVISAEMNA